MRILLYDTLMFNTVCIYLILYITLLLAKYSNASVVDLKLDLGGGLVLVQNSITDVYTGFTA